ncbi:MAG: transcription antitermination protein NusB [Coprobacillus sp.]|nr:transcription antitermination protein NusB [Coprobacillus sp.]
MSALTRNQQHYVTMTVLYQVLLDLDMSKDKTFIDPREMIKDLCRDSDSLFVEQVVYESLNHYKEILDLLSARLRDWKWERLPLLTRSILLMSVAHFQYVEKVDKRIVINIAVDLAKKYIDEKQAKFINALLDGVLA